MGLGGGAGHRPCNPDWVREIRDRCQHGEIAFFHKQRSGIRPKSGGRELDGRHMGRDAEGTLAFSGA
jgi:protein gp37